MSYHDPIRQSQDLKEAYQRIKNLDFFILVGWSLTVAIIINHGIHYEQVRT